jgi:hypothetical protein
VPAVCVICRREYRRINIASDRLRVAREVSTLARRQLPDSDLQRLKLVMGVPLVHLGDVWPVSFCRTLGAPRQTRIGSQVRGL